ncbi:Na+:solute symporter [candidate division KSB1 bacterium]|nr:Na+:solute symporter [candidate division KSB1 bacterium]
MILNALDWTIILSFFTITLLIGLYAMKTAGKSTTEFFLSGRNMSWWLLGTSMVATTFSTDTPNLVTDIVRQNGVAGNWAWWAFLLTGMLTVFVYAKLWRRSNVMTDLEFYEIRYSGKAAAFLRGFRAIYLGAFFNIMVLAMISLALIKIGAVMLHWSALKTLAIMYTITAIYSALGGLRGVVLTDFIQFIVTMIGSVGAAIILLRLPQIGGITNMLAHGAVSTRLALLPDFSNMQELIPLFILPLAVQWWSVWYPGAEPGGGGYIAQRMLSAKSERGALGASLLFNVAHYALRPWPWILVALASLIVFPDIPSMVHAFPNIDPHIIRHDFAYPAMLSLLPNGMLGLVMASLIAAFMSTASTHLNWGASYLVNDFYRRFVRPDATEKHLVFIGRVSTIALMIVSAILALALKNALQAFQILLQVGAGTGLIYILRWFWWRINAYSEIVAMIISFIVAIYFEFVHPITGLPIPSEAIKLLLGVGITTIVWLLATFLTPPTRMDTLYTFYKRTRPGGPGWRYVFNSMKDDEVMEYQKDASDFPISILCMVLGCFTVYAALFATGYWIYGRWILASILTCFACITAIGVSLLWRHLKFH